MCGIFATTRADLWRHKSDAVLARLAHRGPDGSGTWYDEENNVLLLQTRLAVLGLGPAGHQPRLSASSALVFNGEIYNFRELATACQMPTQTSDTAVLQELLDRHGPEATARLKGMWAFVRYDVGTRRLLVGRDTFGIKPLYVLRHATGGATFASELSVLRLSEEVTLDDEGLRRYLLVGHSGPTGTSFEGITKVPAGTTTELQVLAPRRLVQLTVRRAAPASPPDQSLDRALAASVSRHMVSDVPVGVFLSGGVDSTLLATYAREHATSLKTFTVGFPDSPYDESSHARRNARRLGTCHREVTARPHALLGAARRFVVNHGEPLGDPALMPLTLLAEAAVQEVKVVLGGEGADELFGGYARYKVGHGLDQRPWLRRAGVALSPLANALADRRSDSARSRVLQALLSREPVVGHLALLGTETSLLTSGSPHMARHLDELKALWNGAAVPGTSRYQRARAFDEQHLLRETYLEKTDRSTMVVGLEARVPFLDPDVACAALDHRRVPGKHDLATLLKARMPGVELPKHKLGLTVQVREVMSAGLQDSVQSALHSESSVLHRVVTRAEREVLVRRAERSQMTAFRLAMLAVWQELVVE